MVLMALGEASATDSITENAPGRSGIVLSRWHRCHSRVMRGGGGIAFGWSLIFGRENKRHVSGSMCCG